MTDRQSTIEFSDSELDFIYHIAREHALIGEYEKSRMILEGLVRLYPVEKTFCLLAFVYLVLDAFDEAELTLQDTNLRANPSFSRLAITALLKILKSELNEAETTLQQLDNRFPESVLNDSEKAVRNFIQAHLILRKN